MELPQVQVVCFCSVFWHFFFFFSQFYHCWKTAKVDWFALLRHRLCRRLKLWRLGCAVLTLTATSVDQFCHFMDCAAWYDLPAALLCFEPVCKVSCTDCAKVTKTSVADCAAQIVCVSMKACWEFIQEVPFVSHILTRPPKVVNDPKYFRVGSSSRQAVISASVANAQQRGKIEHLGGVAAHK